MEFRLLGPLEVLDEGRPLELGGAKQRALIAKIECRLLGQEGMSLEILVGSPMPWTSTACPRQATGAK